MLYAPKKCFCSLKEQCLVTTFIMHNTFIVRWEGKIKTYEDFLEFKEGLKNALKDYHKSLKSGTDSSQNPNLESNIDSNKLESQENISDNIKIALIDTFPCNTYALGYLLKLKRRDGYNFQISTDNYRLFSLLESIGFDRLFDIVIEQDL